MNQECNLNNLDKIRVEDIPKNRVIEIVGKKRIGKSTLIKDYLKANNLKYGIIFNPCIYEKYDTISSRPFIHFEYNSNIVQNLINIQKKNLKMGKNIEMFVVFDDIFCSKNTCETLKWLCENNRALNISVIFSSQLPIIGNYLRSSVDYTIYFSSYPKLLIKLNPLLNTKLIIKYIRQLNTCYKGLELTTGKSIIIHNYTGKVYFLNNYILFR